jgi:hypothetical protein
MSERWMSIVEYSRAFNVSDMTIRRRIKTGRLHAVLRDGKYYIPLSELEQKPIGSVQRPHQPTNQDRQVMKAHPSPQTTFEPPSLPRTSRPEMANISYRQGNEPEHRAGYQESPIRKTHTEIYEREDYEKDVMHSGPRTAVVARNHIPASLQKRYDGQQNIMVNGQALLDFCDQILAEIKAGEGRRDEVAQEKYARFEAQISLKDAEIKKLSQQVEDLQLLINMIDKAKN